MTEALKEGKELLDMQDKEAARQRRIEKATEEAAQTHVTVRDASVLSGPSIDGLPRGEKSGSVDGVSWQYENNSPSYFQRECTPPFTSSEHQSPSSISYQTPAGDKVKIELDNSMISQGIKSVTVNGAAVPIEEFLQDQKNRQTLTKVLESIQEQRRADIISDAQKEPSLGLGKETRDRLLRALDETYKPDQTSRKGPLW